MGLIPRSGRSPGEGNGNPLQYSYLRNPMDRGAWCATVHRVAKESDMTEQLNNNIQLPPPQRSVCRDLSCGDTETALISFLLHTL